jgi:hypothetical protein
MIQVAAPDSSLLFHCYSRPRIGMNRIKKA